MKKDVFETSYGAVGTSGLCADIRAVVFLLSASSTLYCKSKCLEPDKDFGKFSEQLKTQPKGFQSNFPANSKHNKRVSLQLNFETLKNS